MGWLDNLWRRRQGHTTETPEDTARIRERKKEEETAAADELEQRAHEYRDEEIYREPRIPPGTG
jgi:hypothetical protein